MCMGRFGDFCNSWGEFRIWLCGLSERQRRPRRRRKCGMRPGIPPPAHRTPLSIACCQASRALVSRPYAAAPALHAKCLELHNGTQLDIRVHGLS